MKLRKNRSTYKLPPYGQILYVTLEVRPGEPLRSVIILQPEAWPAKDAGTPAYCAIVEDKIIFYPKPDGPYKAIIRYYPPAQEA